MNTPIKLIEDLNSAAKTAEQIAEEDKQRVNRIKEHILEAQRGSKEAERIARKSDAQFKELNKQVWKLAKIQQVTSIMYNPQTHTSRAHFE